MNEKNHRSQWNTATRRQFIGNSTLTLAAGALASLGKEAPSAQPAAVESTPGLPEIPYPRSDVIKGIRWLTKPMHNPGHDGDVWTCAWAEDDHLYTVADDTMDLSTQFISNLAIDRVEGHPPNVRITRLSRMESWGGRDKVHPPGLPASETRGKAISWKGAGLTSIDGVLYLGIYAQSHPRPGSATKISFSAFYSGILKSTNHGKNWTRSGGPPALFPLFPGREFPTPFFVQYGKDYSGAIDDYVYLVSNDGGWNNWNKMLLARVPRSRFHKLNLADWQFFERSDDRGEPVWNGDVRQAGPIFEHKGYTSMTGIQYVPAVQRFILGQWAYTGVKSQFDRNGFCPEPLPWPADPRRLVHDETMLCLYEAPKPWGPWRLFHAQAAWGPAFYNPNFPAKWFEEGGRRMWIVEGGNFRDKDELGGYNFTVQQLELLTAD